MEFLSNLGVGILAAFLGYELISRVSPTLHTPLMSGSNAISGITMVGAIVCAGDSSFGLISFLGFDWGLSSILGFLALIFATINVVGGFLVTDRMHRMFLKKKSSDS